MRYEFLLFVLFLALFSCKDVNYSKDKHLSTVQITNQLYKERYVIYNDGAIGGAVEAVYLTDSTNFRKYLGKQFDHEMIDIYAINSRALLVYKIDIHTYKVLDSETYLLSELKEEGKFE